MEILRRYLNSLHADVYEFWCRPCSGVQTSPGHFRNKECLQKLDCKCAARGNGPRASRAETEDGRVLKSPQKFH